MQTSQYHERLRDMQDRAHKLHADISTLMDEQPGPHTAEWQALMTMLEACGIVTDMAHRQMYPAPSGMAEPCGADWGSATASQRCVLDAGHDGPHQDVTGHKWPEPGPDAEPWDFEKSATSRLTGA